MTPCCSKWGSELLRSGEKSIAQVAFDTGFADQSHFSRSFRQMMGTTPGRYRRKL
jgi:AraC family transcriptional regulator